MASQPRKGEPVAGLFARSRKLQWGRGFAATEGTAKARALASDRMASMGPWLRSHGRHSIASRSSRSCSCFNGAVASQPRKDYNRRDMGAKWGMLQWGRGFAATEGMVSMVSRSL